MGNFSPCPSYIIVRNKCFILFCRVVLYLLSQKLVLVCGTSAAPQGNRVGLGELEALRELTRLVKEGSTRPTGISGEAEGRKTRAF